MFQHGLVLDHSCALSPDPRRSREAMVRDQIAGRGISDPAVLSAMRKVPRHLFVQKALAPNAYEDSALPIGYGQTISQPFMVAKITELLEIKPGMRVLEVGVGCGYQAAILAAMGCVVFGIERIKEIYRMTAQRLKMLGARQIQLYYGDGTLGLPAAAPFDRIVVSAGGPEVPPPLLEQLEDNGILLIPVGPGSRNQRLLKIRKNGMSFTTDDAGGAVFVDLVGSHGW